MQREEFIRWKTCTRWLARCRLLRLTWQLDCGVLEVELFLHVADAECGMLHPE